jgi:GNAT superfamily N-acetyltransferase
MPVLMHASMVDVRPLTPTDVPAAVRLSNQAGWNQLPADWKRLMHLWPDDCLGGWIRDELVGAATLTSYGADLGWIGMILVDQAYQGHGAGETLFRAALERAEIRGLRYVGLDATESARAMYLKHGFHDQCAIDRWSGSASAIHAISDGLALTTNRARRGKLPTAVLELDYEAVGIDRSPLLTRLHRESHTCCHIVSDGNDAQAAGFARRGCLSWTIGPLVARRNVTALSILRALLYDIASQDAAANVCIDVPRRSPLVPALMRYGFTVRRQLRRMARPLCDGPLLESGLVAAAAGFELG